MIRAGEGKAQCERTADKPASLQTSVITALSASPLSLHVFSLLLLALLFSPLFYIYRLTLLLITFSYTPFVTISTASVCVYLQVISGSNLPTPRSGRALDPFVRVEIHGIPSDSRKKNTHTVKNNCKYNARPTGLVETSEDPALLCSSTLSIQDVFCQTTQQCLTFNFLEMKNDGED